METINVIPAEKMPVEKVVENEFLMELEKSEIRKELLIEKKNECLGLAIHGQHDKDGYNLIKQTRLNQKATRIIIEKVCKAGRDKVAIETKKWLSLEKEWVAIISEGEDYLKKLEDEYDAEKDRLELEKKNRHDAQFTERSTLLGGYGAKLEEGYFVLGDIKYEASSIREVDAEIWEQNIKPKYKAIFDEGEKERLEFEQKKARWEQMRTTIFNARFSKLLGVEIESNRNILYDYKILTTCDAIADMEEKDWETFLSLHNSMVEEEIQKEKERNELKERTDRRTKLLYSLGFTFNGTDYVHETINIFGHRTKEGDDQKWNEIIEMAKRQISEIENEKKQKQEESRKKAQAEADAIALGTARLRMLTDYSFEGYTDKDLSTMIEAEWEKVLMSARTNYNFKQQQLLSQKQKAEKELSDQKQEEELAKAGDKANWDHFVSLVSSIKVPIMKSGKFRNLAGMATEKLQEIITLNAKP